MWLVEEALWGGLLTGASGGDDDKQGYYETPGPNHQVIRSGSPQPYYNGRLVT